MNLISKSPLRVLHVLSGDLWGGAEAQVLLLCAPDSIKADDNHQRSDYFSTQVLLFNSGKADLRFLEAGVPTLIADEGAGFITLLARCISLVKQSQADHGKINVFVAHGYKETIITFLLSMFLNVPWYLQVHGATEGYTGIKKIKSNIYTGAQFLLARLHARRIIFVSNALKHSLGFENSKKALVVHNAAKQPTLTGNSSKNSVESDKVSFLWVGRMTQVKRPDILLRGFKEFLEKYSDLKEQASLTIVGDGPLLNNMKKLAADLSLENITFAGFVTDTAFLYKNQPVLILTSDSEGIPTVILEACHAKCPVITRKVGGIPEIFEKLSDYPVKYIISDSPTEMAEAMREVVTRIKDLREVALLVNTEYFLPNRMKGEHLMAYGPTSVSSKIYS